MNFGSPGTRKRTKEFGVASARALVVRIRPDPGGTKPAFVGGLIGRQVFFSRSHKGAWSGAARNRFFSRAARMRMHARPPLDLRLPISPLVRRSSPPAFHFACHVVWCRGQSRGRWVWHRRAITRAWQWRVALPVVATDGAARAGVVIIAFVMPTVFFCRSGDLRQANFQGGLGE